MNYSIHPQIREALKRAESVNVRGEVSIPLYRLKEELEKTQNQTTRLQRLPFSLHTTIRQNLHRRNFAVTIPQHRLYRYRQERNTQNYIWGMTPPEGCENWIAPFAQNAFDQIIRPHAEIASFIVSTCPLKIS